MNSPGARLIAAVLAATALASLLSAGLWTIHIGHNYPPNAPISYATVHKIYFLSNFLIYAAAVLACMLPGVMLLRRVDLCSVRAFKAHTHGKRLVTSAVLVMLAVIGFTSQSFNSISGSLSRMREPLTATLTDTFHEGELLAPLPSIAGGLVMPHLILAHGPGMDLLPGFIAGRFFPQDSRIAGTRLATALMTLLAFYAFVFASYQVFSFVQPRVGSVDLVSLCAFLLLVFVPYDFLCRGSPRRLIFFIQVGLLFRIFRSRNLWSQVSLIVSALLGATLPLGFLYNYALGVGALVFIAVGSILVCLPEPRGFGKRYLLALSGGAVVTTVAAAIALGSALTAAILPNFSYWSRFGQILTFTPMFRREWITRPEWYCYALLFMVVPAWIGTTLIVEYWQRRSVLLTLHRRAAEVALGTLCMVESRSFLERADFQHFGFGAPVFVLAAAALIVIFAGPRLALVLRQFRPEYRIYVSVCLLALFVVLEYRNLFPGAVFKKVHDMKAAAHTRDQQLLRADYAAAVEAMHNAVAQQSCFYTLNSEGAWYYLFGKPSCSAFAQLNYARTKEGQDRVLQDLRRSRPRFILLNGDLRDGAYDEIPIAGYAPMVWNYVMTVYRPARTIDGFHFYERQP